MFFFSSRRRHTRCALVTGVQTCALPIYQEPFVTHPFIEHVNLTVSDPARTAGLLSAIFGWHERWRGPARDGRRTIHLGSAPAYLAPYTGPHGPHAEARYSTGSPLQPAGGPVADTTTPDITGKEPRSPPLQT